MTDKIEVEVVVITKPLLYAGVTHPVDAVLNMPEEDADLLLKFQFVRESGERRTRKKTARRKSARKNPARYPSTPPSGEHNRRDMQLEGDAK